MSRSEGIRFEAFGFERGKDEGVDGRADPGGVFDLGQCRTGEWLICPVRAVSRSDLAFGGECGLDEHERNDEQGNAGKLSALQKIRNVNLVTHGYLRLPRVT